MRIEMNIRWVSRKNAALRDRDSNDGVCGRNCDRAVQRSPAFEPFDESGRLLAVGAQNEEVQLDAVEGRDVRLRLISAIYDPACPTGHRIDMDLLVTGDHVDELDAASCHRRKENLGRSDLFTRTPVLHGTIDDEVVRPR